MAETTIKPLHVHVLKCWVMKSESTFWTAKIISAGYGDMNEDCLFCSAAGAPVQHICGITFLLTDITDIKKMAILRVPKLGLTVLSRSYICYNLTETSSKPADTKWADSCMRTCRFNVDKFYLKC